MSHLSGPSAGIATDQQFLMRASAPEVFEEITMTAIPNYPATPTNVVKTPAHILSNFPVGGADPDFVVLEASRSAICAVPMLGKMLPQCK